jgi:hypothetical protein
VRLSNGYFLSNHVNAVTTVWGVRVLFLVQQRGMPVAAVAVAAAFGVFGWHQVTDSNLGGFLLLHFSFPFAGVLLFLLCQWHQESLAT